MVFRFTFTKGELDKLSKLCLDLGEGMFLSAVGGPALNVINLPYSFATFILGLIFIWICLRIERIKEDM